MVQWVMYGETKVPKQEFIVSRSGAVKINARLSRGRSFGLVLGHTEDTQRGNLSVRCSLFVSRNAGRRLGCLMFAECSFVFKRNDRVRW